MKRNAKPNFSWRQKTVFEQKLFEDWLKYLRRANDKPRTRTILLNYFFEKFAHSPELFYSFLEHFKKQLLTAPDCKNLAKKYLEIFSSLCERFNFFEEKNTLNDLCFEILDPEKYAHIKNIFSRYEQQSKTIIAAILEKLDSVLINDHSDYELRGRYKNIYSIFKKMEKQRSDALEINDIFAFRIILNTSSPERCFEVANLLHDTFSPLPDYFKDYITIPKINGYQSLHTGLENVIENLDLPIEIQIRTREMDHFAENGLAAHWLYSEEKKSRLITEKEQKLFDYLSCMAHDDEDENFLHCFSDQGDIVTLPKNSTILDFAYSIHTDLGHKTRSALVNGKEKPLYYRLKDGDQIKIIQAPTDIMDKKWLDYAHTKAAYRKIFDGLKQRGKTLVPLNSLPS